MQVLVRDNNVDQALRALKKKMQREGIFREMKMRGHYEKPSEKRAREKAEAVRRADTANFSSFSKDTPRWRDAESPPPFCLERRAPLGRTKYALTLL